MPFLMSGCKVADGVGVMLVWHDILFYPLMLLLYEKCYMVYTCIFFKQLRKKKFK